MNFKRTFKHFIRFLGRTPPVLYVIGMVAYFYSYLVGKTGKFEVTGIKEFEDMIAENDGGIFVAWHGRALMLPYFWQNTRLMKALVSPHADGRIIARLLRQYHILSIDGSSDQKAARAAVEVIKELKAGTAVALIPDGPRGPRMRLNKSVIYFAKKSGKPVMGFTYSSANAKVLSKSWDAMLLPKLWQKGVVLGTKPLYVAEDATEEEMEALRLQFENELNELTFEADERCGIAKIEPEDTVREKRHPHRHRR